jgi:hypothetical protein
MAEKEKEWYRWDNWHSLIPSEAERQKENELTPDERKKLNEELEEELIRIATRRGYPYYRPRLCKCDERS